MMNTLKPVLSHKAALGECPRWNENNSSLYWVDITAPALHKFTPNTNEHVIYPTHEHIGCFAFHEQGGIIAGMRSGIWLLDNEGRAIKKLADNPENQMTSRFNDGRADSHGRFWLGTVDEDKTHSAAHLYMFDGKNLILQKSNLLTSNGLAFSPDDQYLYHSDTPRFEVYRHRFDAQNGTIEAAELFLTMPQTIYGKGRPDGAASDSEGYYWSALFEGAAIIRVSPEGEIVETIPVDAKCPTMCAFGGDNLDTLYVTTASIGRSPEELTEYPLSGALFSMKTKVKGRLEYKCTFNIE